MVAEKVSPGSVVDFRSFFLDEFPGLVALAASTSGDTAEAEDIVQDAMTKASDHWDEIVTYDNPGTWVRRVVINLALNRRRSLGRRAAAVLRIGAPPVAALPQEKDHELWAAVGSLPGRQRAAVVLHYLEDRPVREIAEILDCSESTAKVHLHKARTNLSNRLDRERSR